MPVKHCIYEVSAGCIRPDGVTDVEDDFRQVFEKASFGSPESSQFIRTQDYVQVGLNGLDTDSYVVSNALIIKVLSPEKNYCG